MKNQSAAIDLIISNQSKPDVALAVMKSISDLELIKFLGTDAIAGMQSAIALCRNGVKLCITNTYMASIAMVDLVGTGFDKARVIQEDLNALESIPFAKVLTNRGFRSDEAFMLPNGQKAITFMKLVAYDNVLSYVYTYVTLPKVMRA